MFANFQFNLFVIFIIFLFLMVFVGIILDIFVFKPSNKSVLNKSFYNRKVRFGVSKNNVCIELLGSTIQRDSEIKEDLLERLNYGNNWEPIKFFELDFNTMTFKQVEEDKEDEYN
jgi:hypothetical protein